jgi:hypothetical protein
MADLEKLIRGLPPDLKQEVEDFIQFLLSKRAKKEGTRFAPELWWSFKRISPAIQCLGFAKKGAGVAGRLSPILLDTNFIYN